MNHIILLYKQNVYILILIIGYVILQIKRVYNEVNVIYVPIVCCIVNQYVI